MAIRKNRQNKKGIQNWDEFMDMALLFVLLAILTIIVFFIIKKFTA